MTEVEVEKRGKKDEMRFAHVAESLLRPLQPATDSRAHARWTPQDTAAPNSKVISTSFISPQFLQFQATGQSAAGRGGIPFPSASAFGGPVFGGGRGPTGSGVFYLLWLHLCRRVGGRT